MSSETEIRSFRVDMPDEAVAGLRRRIADTRWPTRELVADRSQGVQLATLQELARYWTTDYDWRACEATMNALPQFTTEIDGEDIHFIHVRSSHAAGHGAGMPRPEVKVPVGFTTFPGEIFRAPRSWAEKSYPASPTSTRPAGAATSPPGKSPSCSQPRSGRHSARCDSTSQGR